MKNRFNNVVEITNFNLFVRFYVVLFLIFSYNINKISAIDYSNRQNNQNAEFDKQKPIFKKVPPIIEVTPGQTAILSCIVMNLGDRMVSWIRSTDLQILTAGPVPFTVDQRFSSEFPYGGENSWGLLIKNARATDTGNYECQINTEPKMKNNVTLIVREPLLMDVPYRGTQIDEPREKIVKSGTIVTFICTSPYPDNTNFDQNVRQMLWLKDNDIISFQARGGINVHTEWGLSSVKSSLTLTSVTVSDNGEYSCKSTWSGSDSATLLVINGAEKQDASTPSTQHNLNSSTKRHNKFYNVLIQFFLIYLLFVII